MRMSWRMCKVHIFRRVSSVRAHAHAHARIVRFPLKTILRNRSFAILQNKKLSDKLSNAAAFGNRRSCDVYCDFQQKRKGSFDLRFFVMCETYIVRNNGSNGMELRFIRIEVSTWCRHNDDLENDVLKNFFPSEKYILFFFQIGGLN